MNEARAAHEGAQLPLEQQPREVDVCGAVDRQLSQKLARGSRPENVRRRLNRGTTRGLLVYI